jgi:hypothetical protein
MSTLSNIKKIEININDDELLKIKWEHTRNILKRGGVGEEDFVQV